jgi:excisionase family DNA binding protein
MPIDIPTAEDIRAIVREEMRAALREAEARRERHPLAVPEAARELGVSTRTLRRHIAAGEIPVVRIGRAVRVDMAAVIPSEATVTRLVAVARRGG